jgi:type I restriction enzyme S subunit
MGGDWREVSIGALAHIFDGPHATPAKTDTGPIFLGISNLDRGRLNLSTTEHLSEEDYERWTRRVTPEAGDVVFSYETRLGEAALIPPNLPCCLGRRMGLLRPKTGKVDARFLLYAYLGPDFQETLRARTVHGSTVDRIPLTDMPKFPIRVPADVREQRAIAHILGTLDDKIELDRRMNETLEGIARALFKSWFVDFDPVRAKAEGRDTGLPREIADLFPGGFEESELGEIPAGWEIAALGDHFDAVKGVSYKGSGLSGVGTPLHNLNSIYEGGGYKYEGIKYYNGEHAERHVVRPGDVIVANTEQGHDRLLIGYAAIVPRSFGNHGIASHHIYRLRPKPRTCLTAGFACHLLNSPQMHDMVSGYANGTTVNMLPLAGVQQPHLVVPPGALVVAFDALATRTESRREEMVMESRTLAALRDTLLPKLLSGEIRVGQAEKVVEAAL